MSQRRGVLEGYETTFSWRSLKIFLSDSYEGGQFLQEDRIRVAEAEAKPRVGWWGKVYDLHVI